MEVTNNFAGSGPRRTKVTELAVTTPYSHTPCPCSAATCLLSGVKRVRCMRVDLYCLVACSSLQQNVHCMEVSAIERGVVHCISKPAPPFCNVLA